MKPWFQLTMRRGKRSVLIGFFPTRQRASIVGYALDWSSDWRLDITDLPDLSRYAGGNPMDERTANRVRDLTIAGNVDEAVDLLREAGVEIDASSDDDNDTEIDAGGPETDDDGAYSLEEIPENMELEDPDGIVVDTGND